MPISRQLQSTAAILLIAAGAAACSSPRANVPPPSAVDTLSPAPSGRVTTEPLAPPPGAQAAIDPLPPEPDAPPPDLPPGAGGEPPPPVTPRVASSGRSSVVGGWTATDAKGSCRIALSSSPALDLYKASATSCANPELAKVSAWDYRDGEVFLYQPGGTVTARLKQAGASLDGQLARSGAAISMIR